jgi:hypothetical protein
MLIMVLQANETDLGSTDRITEGSVDTGPASAVASQLTRD